MANFRTTDPGHTSAIVNQPLPDHPAGTRKAQRSAVLMPITGMHRAHPHKATAAVADTSAADVTAIAAYVWNGKFDRIKLHDGFMQQFSKDPHFDAAAIPHLELLIGFIENDAGIKDIRWMAYMLATAYWETTSLKKETVPTLDKHGKQLLDKKGRPLVHSRQRWLITMSPVEEVGHGAGRKYFLPVKVKSLPGGEARVTEQDGDQFTVSSKGKQAAITKGAKIGAAATQKAVKAYTDDDGDELTYFGRGYVQLTWWSNYAQAGARLDMGLQLLLEPDQVLQPDIAYKLMANGMRTGEGFANGHKFSDYFHGAYKDYIKARAMVNGTDHAVDIAGIASRFETTLLNAKS